MNILICPDSFKGTLSSIEVCEIIKSTLIKSGISPESIITQPIADGGEGTLDCLERSLTLPRKSVLIHNPIGQQTQSYYLYDSKNEDAYIELANCSGLMMLKKNELNPFCTSTYGLGEMILSALQQKPAKIFIGIGGSATNDGGIGLLQALGATLTSESKDYPLLTKDLLGLKNINLSKLSKKFQNTTVIVMSDVQNKLLGKNGATYTYAEQKGASKKDLPLLESCLKKLNQISIDSLNVDLSIIAGGGAAGGVGACLVGLIGAKIKPGLSAISEIIGLEEEIKKADLIITGEGKMDSQTVFDKAPFAICKIAKKHGKKVVAINGFLEKDPGGFDAVYGTNNLENFSMDKISERARFLLEEVTVQMSKDLNF